MGTIITPQAVAGIAGRRRRCIDLGGYAVVYRVGSDRIAKVGQIEPEEVEAQRYLARLNQALPVIDYAETVELPSRLHHETCPVHGLRKAFLGDGYYCTCDLSVDVLLMPLADTDLSRVSAAEIQAFRMAIAEICERDLHRCWDDRPANVARYQGHLVALDFGEESG